MDDILSLSGSSELTFSPTSAVTVPSRMNRETGEISSEQIDDIPVVVEWLKKMEIAKWIDKSRSKPHGNHQGMSYGQLCVLLLTYIITQADHR